MTKLPASRIQVLVAHPDPLLALGLAAALGQQSGIEVVSSGAAQVVLTDYAGGLALAGTVRAGARPGRAPARVLVLAAQDREQEVRTALERGVHGYLLAGSRVDEVVEGIRALAQGQRYLSLAAAQRMADSMTREHLTGRESDVLGLLVQGCCNKTIARQLEIAVGTVKAHVKGIMSKLQASSRTQVVSIAMARGLAARH
ncbi:response regulator transcription factor [Pseudorhodoferax sp. LjRoot39]|jgi:DNA-binding NarL/FixJ family response regulator|uniref:LuxR C-terminal-related transcriptional regulator n=1 Tax=Pseudorhodoferax sp. LjRoot39 TaxID=3342328 RepID=UPI003ED0E9C8